MDRKECYRLTHPLSKISGYATASTPGQNGRSVRQRTHTSCAWQRRAVLSRTTSVPHGADVYSIAVNLFLPSPPLPFPLPLPFLPLRSPSHPLRCPFTSLLFHFYLFLLLLPFLFVSFPSLPSIYPFIPFHPLPFLLPTFPPLPLFDPPFLFPSFPVIFPETAWVSMTCCLHYCGVSAIIRCARSSPSVRASSPASRLSRTGCSSSDTLKLCFAASRRAIADKISSTQRG